MKAWVITYFKNICENNKEKVVTMLSARKTPEQVISDLHVLYSAFSLLPSESLPYIKYKSNNKVYYLRSPYAIHFGDNIPESFFIAYKAENITINVCDTPQIVNWQIPEHKIWISNPTTHEPYAKEIIQKKYYSFESIMPITIKF